MSELKPSLPQSQPAVHPSDITNEKEWDLSRQSIQARNLIVEHHLQPPDEVEVPALTHHLLTLQLSEGTRQITRLDGHEYDGLMTKGNLWLAPADISGFWRWETTDECLKLSTLEG